MRKLKRKEKARVTFNLRCFANLINFLKLKYHFSVQICSSSLICQQQMATVPQPMPRCYLQLCQAKHSRVCSLRARLRTRRRSHGRMLTTFDEFRVRRNRRLSDIGIAIMNNTYCHLYDKTRHTWHPFLLSPPMTNLSFFLVKYTPGLPASKVSGARNSNSSPELPASTRMELKQTDPKHGSRTNHAMNLDLDHHKFWIPTGREPLNIFHWGSFQLSKFLMEFHRGRWMICRF
jgi:hypothetical protein